MNIDISNLTELKYALDKRATGKTTLLQTGIKNYNQPFLFVCDSIQRGRFETCKNTNAIYITPDTYIKLQGRSDLPIIFNHDAVSDLINRVIELDAENEYLKGKLNMISKLAD